MQVKKEEIYHSILETARQEFHEKGFNGTGLREIARRAGISTSNIYNYFKNKDDIFYAVLKPLISSIDKAFYSAEVSGLIHDKNAWNYTLFREQIVIVSGFILSNRKDLELLAFKSQGSGLHNYKDNLIRKYADSLAMKVNFLNRHLSPEGTELSKEFILTISTFYFNILQDLVKRSLKGKVLDQYITEISTFIYYGWRSLLKIDKVIGSSL